MKRVKVNKCEYSDMCIRKFLNNHHLMMNIPYSLIKKRDFFHYLEKNHYKSRKIFFIYLVRI
jgi:hypothetical protein